MPAGPRRRPFRDTAAPPNLAGWAPITTSLVPRHRFVFPSRYRYSVLTYLSAPEDLPRKLWVSDATARDALSSFLDECFANDMFCFDFLDDHAVVPARDSHDDRRDAVLTHLLNGECISASSPSCKLFTRDALGSAMNLSYLLCTLLLDAHQNRTIAFHIFSQCCVSIGLRATTPHPGRELKLKLQQQLKHQKPLIECQSVFNTFNKLELLGLGSLAELASLHDIQLDSSARDALRDAIVQHLIAGACENMDGEMCRSTRLAYLASSSDRSKPIDLQMFILDGVVKAVNRKPFSRILCGLGVLHSPTDSIKIFQSLLRKHCVHLRGEKRTTPNQDSRKLGSQRDHDAGLVGVGERWPERASHAEKANMIHDFRSLTSSNALRSFTCASCAERVRGAK